MKCKALRDGYFKGHYTFEGEVFDAESCPSWAEVIEGAKAPSLPAQKKSKATVKKSAPIAELEDISPEK